jgi:hypothetical protein
VSGTTSGTFIVIFSDVIGPGDEPFVQRPFPAVHDEIVHPLDSWMTEVRMFSISALLWLQKIPDVKATPIILSAGESVFIVCCVDGDGEVCGIATTLAAITAGVSAAAV